MSRTEIQRELDRVEEYVLTQLFGDSENLQISSNLKMAFVFKGIDIEKFINEKISEFENFMINFMREDGFLDVEKIENIVSIKIPILSGLKLPQARLIDVIKMIEQFIPLKRIGEIIRKI